MASSYPGALDAFTNPTSGDSLSTSVGGRTHSQMHRDENDAIEAIQAELGTDPSGSLSTVKARLDTLGGFGGKHLVGNYHFNAASGGTTNDVFTVTSGTLYAVPFWVPVTCTYDQIFTKIGTAGGGGSVMRLGIYNVASSGDPGTLVLDAGTIDTSTTGNKTLTISQSLSAGVYFIVNVSSSSTTQMRALGSSPARNPLGWFGNPADNADGYRYRTFTGYTAGSALPSTATTAGASGGVGDIPMVILRAA